MSEGQELQFERAEFENAPAQAQCAECNRQLTGFYFDVNGQTVCEACKYTIEARLTGGSAAGRFVRATGAGVVAAAIGSAIYYAISALTGYEFGLIAIVVGYAVGSAVRWGSDGRGGKSYQALAIALTYMAIVTTYIPPIVEELRKGPAIDAEAVQAGAVPTTPTASATPASATTDAPSTTPPADTMPGLGGLVFAVLVLLAIACVAPFFAGFENIIGIVIIGIGLYEAWKLNRRSTLTITGPHALARPPIEAAGA